MAEPDIFLSYNREDAEVARRFAEGFEAQGFDVWWDQALRSGEAYDKVTEVALRGAKAVVVLWSPRSVDSRWVRAEATIADRNGTLVPAKIEHCDLPVMFELTQTADLSGWQGAENDKAWLAFLGDVGRMVGQETTEPVGKSGSATAPSTSGKSNVGVLPITCRGGGEELEFFAEDLTEEITRDLARSSRSIRVIAAGIMAGWRGERVDYRKLGLEFGARYLAEGKLQRSGDNVRLTMQLVSTGTGDIAWSKRFVRNAEEVEAAVDEFTAAVVSELDERLHFFEVTKAMAKTGPISGWEHLLRAQHYMTRFGWDDARSEIEEGLQAIAAAPERGLAHALLAAIIGTQVITAGRELDDALSREIQTHVRKAVQLGGDDPTVFNYLSVAYTALGDPEMSVKLAQREIERNPGSPYAYLGLGFASMHAGRATDAIAAFEQQDRLTAYDRNRHQALYQLGMCYLIEGRPEEANQAFDRSLALFPEYDNALKWKAIAAAYLGDEGTSLATTRRLRSLEPDKSIDQHVQQMMFYKGLRDRLTEPVATLRRLWDETEGDG